MKKFVIVGVFLLLVGCVEVENYNNVVKIFVLDWLVGYW